MRKEYKYVYFLRIDNGKKKTKMWECNNRSWHDVLGVVKWYAQWRQYCYFPEPDTVYSAGCLEDITDFIKIQMRERKKT